MWVRLERMGVRISAFTLYGVWCSYRRSTFPSSKRDAGVLDPWGGIGGHIDECVICRRRGPFFS